ncbi:hypothetical protein V1264_005787 [Littorina saxatilis]
MSNADESELQLSCESSDFESELETSELPYSGAIGIEPYQFEPQGSSDEDERPERPAEEVDRSRLLSTHTWCQCGNCGVMDTIKVCRCCTKIEEMGAVMGEEGVNCITQHPHGFQSVCLDIYVLRTCYRWYHQQFGRNIVDENNRYRYTAYRMLARFVWGWLGKDLRVTLPACAVRRIRENFPSATGQYTGYLEPEN